MGVFMAAALLALSGGWIDMSGDWHVTAPGIDAQIRLPGTLGGAKLGRRWTENDFKTTLDLPQSEALVQEYQYVGPAEYERSFELSEELCTHDLELVLERVMWKSEVWMDDKPLGVQDSLSTPHSYLLPKAWLSPGRHRLRMRIDNSNIYNFSRQSHAYGPNMQAVWNGVLGRLELRRKHRFRTARVFAQCPAAGRFEVEVDGEVADLSVEGLAVRRWQRENGRIVVRFDGEPIYWNEFHPQLYVLRLKDPEGFEHSVRFGFRTVGTRGHALTLNGNDIFTRGNVENANFAADGVPWMTVSEWRKMFVLLRDEDGVNTIRFHSWTPPEAAFAAADETGVMLQPEACMWTDRWMSDGDEVGNGKPVDSFVRKELRRILDAYGNSPSFISLSIGNELGNSNFPVMEEWLDELRGRDPRVLYYCSSARSVMRKDDFSLSHVVPNVGHARGSIFPKTDWDYEKTYAQAALPTIAHEIGQWPVYPIWEDLLTPFVGAMRPWNLSRHRDTAAREGTVRFADRYHTASAKLNRILYKDEVESFLRTPSCAGLQLLNVQDYTGQAEALVGWRDPFYGLKRGFRNLPPFSTVWGPIGYLARFEKYNWTVGERFSARFQIRNMTDSALRAGTAVPYELVGTKGELRIPFDIEPGHLGEVGEVSLELTPEMTKAKQRISFGTNCWNFWVFPKEEKCAWPTGIVVTSDPAEMQLAIKMGQTVLYGGPSFNSGKGRFKPVYWSARWFPVPNKTCATLGTWFDVGHPALSAFPTEDFADWQWYSLARGATVHAILGSSDDMLPIGLAVSDFHFSCFSATMFEVLIGEGRLFVCGYDLEKDDPAAKRLRASIAAYLGGPVARNTARRDADWLAKEICASPKAENLSGAVYDVSTNWTGRTFSLKVKGFAPVTGDLRVDFYQPENGLTSGRGLLEGKAFDVPFTERQGATTFVSLPIVREDMLDGELDFSVNLMTGRSLGISRIRVIPRNED